MCRGDGNWCRSRYRELRALELAEESRCRRLAAEAARRERLALDELALLTRSHGASCTTK